MSGDAKIRKPGGLQPNKKGVTKGNVIPSRGEVGMDGYQPRLNEGARDYHPAQPVDMGNLKIPKNLGTAAVIPRSGGDPARAPVDPKKD
jgi:hypothetical protein